MWICKNGGKENVYLYKKKWTFFFIFFVCTFFLPFLFFSRLVHFFCVLAYTGNCMWQRGVPELHPSSDSYLAKVVNRIPPHRYILGYRYIASILYIYLFFLFSSSFLPLLLLFFLLRWIWNFHNISKVHRKKLQTLVPFRQCCIVSLGMTIESWVLGAAILKLATQQAAQNHKIQFNIRAKRQF